MEFQIRPSKIIITPRSSGFAQSFSNEDLVQINNCKTQSLVFIDNYNGEVSVQQPVELNMQKIHALTKIAVLPPELVTFFFDDLKSVNEEIAEIKQPEDLEGEMSTHQLESLAFCAARKACMLALEMGLGKTLVAIAAILNEKTKRNIVVCPAALKSNWRSEFSKFAPKLTTMIIKSTKHFQKCYNDTNINVFIVSFSLLDYIQTELMQTAFDVVVADEAHYLKTSQAKRSKAFKGLSKKCKKLILMTGTPGESHANLFNLLHLISPQLFKYFHHFDTRRVNVPACVKRLYFAERYCSPEVQHVIGGRKVFVFKISQRADELKCLIRKSVITMKKDLVLNLPPLLRQKIVLNDLSVKKKKYFTDEMSRIETLRESKGALLADSALMELVRETMRTKSNDVCNYVKMILSSRSEKMILFFHHTELRDAIKDFLEIMKIEFIVVDGSTPMTKRPDLYKRFETDEKCQIGLLSLQACSTGLNFQFVSLILFCELLFSSNTHVQAEARSHRMGQKNKVLCQYLLMSGTTDDIIWRSLARKSNVQNVLMSSNNNSEECKNSWVFETVLAADVENTCDKKMPTKCKKRKKKEMVSASSFKKNDENDEELIPLKKK
jgi:SWI/SNF-related matrix-associated actin-dependent regulator 1 of chromatin subfamily A